MAGGAPLLTPTKATLMRMNMNRTQNPESVASYFTMIGTITRSFQLNPDGPHDSNRRLPWYKACPDLKMKNAKVTDNGQGKYHCIKNGKDYDTYIPRFVTRFCVSDTTGDLWLNAFNDQATMILGNDCKTVENYYNNGNYEKVRDIFLNSHLKRFVFRVRAKTQEYNGEIRPRYDLVNVQPVNYEYESKLLKEKIELLKRAFNQE